MKRVYFSILVALGAGVSAQVGIGTTTPSAKLDVVATTPTGTSGSSVDGLLIPRVDRARAQSMGNSTSTPVPESTMIYVSDISTGTAANSSVNIDAKGFYYFDKTSNTWLKMGVTAAISSNASLDTGLDYVYASQLKIPPHAGSIGAPADFTNHTNTTYDSDADSKGANWWVISKTSITPAENTQTTTRYPSKLVVVYEYQGTPFSVDKLYPLFSPGNSSSFPDIFQANLISLVNNGTNGRTRLTVAIVRLDQIGSGGWLGSFLMNTALIKNK